MFWALAICLGLIIIICVFGLPEKWNDKDRVQKFDPHCITPGLADIYFQDFVRINERRGIKINLVSIKSTNWGIIYYYTEEKLNATNEN